MIDDLSSPHRPVRLLARFQSSTLQISLACVIPFFLLILLKTIKRIGTNPNRKPSPPFDSADSIPSLGHPALDSGKMVWL